MGLFRAIEIINKAPDVTTYTNNINESDTYSVRQQRVANGVSQCNKCLDALEQSIGSKGQGGFLDTWTAKMIKKDSSEMRKVDSIKLALAGLRTDLKSFSPEYSVMEVATTSGVRDTLRSLSVIKSQLQQLDANLSDLAEALATAKTTAKASVELIEDCIGAVKYAAADLMAGVAKDLRQVAVTNTVAARELNGKADDYESYANPILTKLKRPEPP